MLPFVIAAKSGDRGAERELLLRLTPIALEAARGAYGARDPDVQKLALETLVATLKALPTFRGDESISDAVAQIALERAKLDGRPLSASEPAILAAARLRAQRGASSGDGSRIISLVERALEDDAAVLVSHIMVRTPPASGRRAYTITIIAGLALAGVLGWLWVSHAESSTSPSEPDPSRVQKP